MGVGVNAIRGTYFLTKVHCLLNQLPMTNDGSTQTFRGRFVVFLFLSEILVETSSNFVYTYSR